MKTIKRYASYVTVNNILKTEGYVPLKHHSVNINGRKQGFTGFFLNPRTGYVMYIATDITCCADTVMLRSAKSEHDYTGGHNEYCSNVEDLLSIAAKVTR